MNASFPTCSRLSSCHAAAWTLLALATSFAGCDKKADGTPSAASASAVIAAPAPAAAKKAATTLKLADLKHAYQAEFDDMSKAAIPIDKKVEAFVAKVGKPESDSGRTKTWYALDGDKCTKVGLDGKDGSMTEETTGSADCGM